MGFETELPTVGIDRESLDRYIQSRVQEIINAPEATDALTALSRTDSLNKKFRIAKAIFCNNGFLAPQDELFFESKKDREEARLSYNALVDAMSSPDAAVLIPKVMSEIMREAVEPQLVLTSLFRRIRFSAGPSVSFPAMSAMSGVKDMAEGEEYPELMGPRFAGVVNITMGKVGCKVRITEEILRWSQWDIMNMLITGAGKAMARHKEVKCANLISDSAKVSFDNDNPANSDHGKTTGRAIDGTGNGTLRLDDLFTVYADLVNDGFIPNTLIMNALGWLIFARDATMRAFGFLHGGPLFRTAQGAPGLDPSWKPNLNKHPSASELSLSSTRFVDVPALFPVPLTIVVSPFVNFDTTNNKTDIFMVDREELGLMVVDEDLMTDSFDDPHRDIRLVKFRERYGLATLNEGLAIRKIANVSTAKGYDFEDDKTTWDLATNALPTL